MPFLAPSLDSKARFAVGFLSYETVPLSHRWYFLFVDVYRFATLVTYKQLFVLLLVNSRIAGSTTLYGKAYMLSISIVAHQCFLPGIK
jgi:hypothetical protein